MRPRLRALGACAALALVLAVWDAHPPGAPTAAETRRCYAIQWELARALSKWELETGNCAHVGLGEPLARALYLLDGPGWPDGVRLTGIPRDPGAGLGSAGNFVLTGHMGLGLACARHGFAVRTESQRRPTARGQFAGMGFTDPDGTAPYSRWVLPEIDRRSVPGVVPQLFDTLENDEVFLVRDRQRPLVASLEERRALPWLR